MKATVLIVTRNRAADLRQTLEAFKGVRIPAGLDVELLVVDNGSSDDTADVVKSHKPDGYEVRYLLESRAGKSNGLNLGISESKGDVVIFTDDDVRPPADWIEGMCEPVLSGRADVVAGGMKLAPHLLRPWMTPMHRSWLAASEWLTPGDPESLVGANMAVSKEVFKKVPGFDPELGGGGLGFCEDGLFAAQLKAAGFRFTDRFDICMEHHLDPSRLKRTAWLEAAEKRGRSHAYRGHHWDHWGCRLGPLKVLRARIKLALWRALNRDKMAGEEGCHEKEVDLVYQLALVRGHLEEAKRARNYQPNGLVKLESAR